ncbi:hypothetical protein ACFJIX_09965 [Roseateles sp. UC29_93]|uniref:hypothetical protein n=1 Tax=Roseateles sp. UC29_93 TaxID=3350177 RepID=UPI003671B861
MTSEVLLLNKRAIVIGADSAATTSSGSDHPRYSKSANKIFELTKNGAMAAAVFGNASIDAVPWELAIKLFRSHLGPRTFNRTLEYAAAIISFLTANDRLFPTTFREQETTGQFDAAIKEVARLACNGDESILDTALPLDLRRSAWDRQVNRIRAILNARGVAAPLTEEAMHRALEDLDPWVRRAQIQIAGSDSLQAMDCEDLADLGHRLRYVMPEVLLPRSGLVIAGYGEDQIFPSYVQLEIFGHLGDELFYRLQNSYEMTRDGDALIQPFAMSSMINVFTDGFDRALEGIVNEQSQIAFAKVFQRLHEAGIDVPDQCIEQISDTCQRDFMADWKRLNWQSNRAPLLGILQSLGIEEMAHLATSLLELQSLKERVTSSTETVGGPIDVAVITKEEGLVWIHRKHFFDLSRNTRYSARLHHSLA